MLNPFRVRCEESVPPQGQFHLQTFFASQADLMGLGQPVSLGLVSGFCSGYFLKKVGKAAVVSSGVVFLLFQAAAQKQYLTINWPKVDEDFKSFVRKFQSIEASNREFAPERALSDFARLCTEKTGITSGAFMAGFILGLKKG